MLVHSMTNSVRALVSGRSQSSPVWRALLVLTVLVGLGVRLALLIQAGWRYDYDEGMVGLQVLRILRGARPVFHPGQPYLAALESYLIAPWFAAFGANAVTLKVVPWLLSGGYVASVGWLGWRAFEPAVGVLAALLAACAPVYLLVVGIKTWGATAETLLLGNLLLIAASYAVDPARSAGQRSRALVATGLLGGVAFWVSWLSAFYAAPVGIVLIWRWRSVPRQAWAQAAPAFLAGSSPFWFHNLRHDWVTFEYLLRDQNDQGGRWDQLWPVLDHLNYDVMPRLVSGDPEWHVLSWPAIWYLQIFYQAGLVALWVWAWRGRHLWPDGGHAARKLLALFALGVPVLYVLSGYGNHALNEHGFDATGRYLLMWHSVLPIGAAALVIALARWRPAARWAAAGGVTLAIGLNLLGAVRADPVRVFASPYYTRQPATLEPLIAYLDAEGVRHVWTDVGIAHVLMFETGERILAADWYDIYGARGIVRFPEVPLAIAAADRVAYVEVALHGQQDTRFERAFRAGGAAHTIKRLTVGPAGQVLVVIIPLEPVDPASLGDGLGYQF